QLADDLRVASELEVGVDALLESRNAEVVQSPRLELRESFRELGERRPAPEVGGVADQSRPALEVADGQSRPPFLQQPLEANGVDALRLRLEDVARRARLERRLRQKLPQLRDVHLHARHRRLRWVVAPDL